MDDYELQVLQKGHCPFCRAPSENRRVDSFDDLIMPWKRALMDLTFCIWYVNLSIPTVHYLRPIQNSFTNKMLFVFKSH